MAKRIYVAGEGKDLVFCIVESREDAKITLGPSFRVPDPDDMRIVWRLAKLDSMTGEQATALLGVSRQTIHNWWHKAGGAGVLPRRSDHTELHRREKMRQVAMHSGESPTRIAKKLGTSIAHVKQMAQKMGVQLSNGQKRPSDEQLIELAKGRTWYELAEASGLQLSTLRTYIYKRPELSAAIAAVRKRSLSGKAGQGKIDVEKLRQLRSLGYSAYRISQELRVEPMTIRHWFKRLAKEDAANDRARNQQAFDDFVAGRRGGLEY